MTASTRDDALVWGVEPAPGGLKITHEEGRSLRAEWNGKELFRYVYQPWDPPLESPKPYFHPLRTLNGDVVSLYRPHDHLWHKGLMWGLTNLGSENFFGGHTYVRGRQYVFLPNNGVMRHDTFEPTALDDGGVRLTEHLTWITQAGETWVKEERRIAAAVWADADAWVLSFETAMRNVSGNTIQIGSPTTEGRENAGYSGFVWRGPREFNETSKVVTPDGIGADELMGYRGPWMGFVGYHDGHAQGSTLLFRDHPKNFSFPNKWFVRTQPYGFVGASPFFDEEYSFTPGEELRLRYDLVIANGAKDVAGCTALDERAASVDLLDTDRG